MVSLSSEEEGKHIERGLGAFRHQLQVSVLEIWNKDLSPILMKCFVSVQLRKK